MDRPVLELLDLAQGPVFRAAFALLVLGVLRNLILAASDIIAAYVSVSDKREFRQKLRWRLLWGIAPSVVLQQHRPTTRGMFAYHLTLCCLSLIMRIGAILVPAFMVAHVYLWERGLGISWPALPGDIADALAVITIIAGSLLFLGRLYSPTLRNIEPVWSFFKPLILILPFASGFLAMHPLMSPFNYHFVMLIHVLSACAVFVLIPFGRLMSCMHVRVTDLIPEADWRTPTTASQSASASLPSVT